eukprot:scaffold389_cov382-Prasinococcus_capsulatus_cf.AAC.12
MAMHTKATRTLWTHAAVSETMKYGTGLAWDFGKLGCPVGYPYAFKGPSLTLFEPRRVQKA